MRAIDARSLLNEAVPTLAGAGVGSARVDAELLLSWSAGIDRGKLLLADIDVEQVTKFRLAVDRRASGEPLQHITGLAPFRHLTLNVGPGVFVPRPETELLVDAALADLRGLAEPVVVDLGSGSGALALAVADEVPSARVYAVERSASALLYLRRNAAGTSVAVIEADIADPHTLDALSGIVDVVLSNPPYVPSGTQVAPEVDHDPAEAVFAGSDGLAVMPDLARTAARLLRAGGLVVIEHDDTHGESVPELLRSDGAWTEITDHLDLSGRPRFVSARRRT